MNKFLTSITTAIPTLLIAMLVQLEKFKDPSVIKWYTASICLLSAGLLISLSFGITYFFFEKMLKEKDGSLGEKDKTIEHKQEQYTNMERMYQAFINSGKVPTTEKMEIPAEDKKFGTGGK